jgi:hypothetical protein
MALVAEAAGARSVADRPVNEEIRLKFKKFLSGLCPRSAGAHI